MYVGRPLTFPRHKQTMFGRSSIFRSRWVALLWSAGIIWTALDVSGAFDHAENAAIDAASNDGAADVQQVQDLVAKLKAS